MIGLLLRPGRIAAGRFVADRERIYWGRLLGALLFGALVLALVFLATARGIRFVSGVEVIGALLASRLLELTLLSVTAFVLMSALAAALATFYLADDLSLVRAVPVRERDFFLARWVQTALLAGWMAVGFSLPVLGAYGYTLGGGWRFGALLAAVLPPLVMLPTALAVLVITLLVCIFPARRVKELFLVLGVLGAALLLLLFRMARPETLVRPEVFGSVANYVTAFEIPQNGWLPSTWAAEVLQATILGDRIPWLSLALLWSALWAVGAVTYAAHGRLYRLAYTRAQEGGASVTNQGRRIDALIDFFTARRRGPLRAFSRKDTRVFAREPAQWSQLLLLGILIVAYVYNYAVFPGATVKLAGMPVNHLLGVLNLMLAGFVLSALVARFAFPAVSTEGRAFWLVRTAPVDPGRFLRIKLRLAAPPLVLLAIVLAGLTAYWLLLPWTLIAASVVHIAVSTFVLTAMGIGFGAIYPRFKFENPAQVPMSFGGILFMLTAILYAFLGALLTAWILVPLAVPRFSRPPAMQGIWLSVWLTFHILHAIIPLRLGIRALRKKEYS